MSADATNNPFTFSLLMTWQTDLSRRGTAAKPRATLIAAATEIKALDGGAKNQPVKWKQQGRYHRWSAPCCRVELLLFAATLQEGTAEFGVTLHVTYERRCAHTKLADWGWLVGSAIVVQR